MSRCNHVSQRISLKTAVCTAVQLQATAARAVLSSGLARAGRWEQRQQRERAEQLRLTIPSPAAHVRPRLEASGDAEVVDDLERALPRVTHVAALRDLLAVRLEARNARRFRQAVISSDKRDRVLHPRRASRDRALRHVSGVEEKLLATELRATAPAKALLADEFQRHLLEIGLCEGRASQGGQPVLVATSVAAIHNTTTGACASERQLGVDNATVRVAARDVVAI